MEIDFLGLSSSNYTTSRQPSNHVFTDSEGGVETSLSLRTTSLDSHRQVLSYPEKKKQKRWEFSSGGDKMSPASCSGSRLPPENPGLLLVATPVFHRPGFLYDAASTSIRSFCEVPTQAPTMLYPLRPNIFAEQEKAENTRYMAGNASTRGYTPTVAMARRATLARFLEKRLHRMNQAMASPLMGKPVNAEPWETSITKCNKRNNLKTR